MSVSSVTDTCCARASPTSIGNGEVLMPRPQKVLFLRPDEPFDLLEFCCTIPTAASQPNGIEPELRAIRISFHMNVWGFGSVRSAE